MNTKIHKKLTSLVLYFGVFTAFILTGAKINSQEDTSITIDGSSTVYPITAAVVKDFESTRPEASDIELNVSGTGGGFAKFCAGETEINNASRPITKAEMDTCKAAGVAYIELPIAFDALTVVVNPNNDWLNEISLKKLSQIWSPEAEQQITRWNQVDSSLPNRPLNLYGPGTDSGTFDYFTEAVVGESGSSRSDYLASEDDDVLVQGIEQDPNALGYFGYAYYEANQNNLKALAIDSGNGAVLPSSETVEAGKYQPLSRPLFIYINSSAAQDNPALKEFVEFYLNEVPQTATEVGYVALSEDGYQLDKLHFTRGKVGTVFDGQAALNLTLGELLRKRANF
ncbi:PstS family phosphate ABC transporter substrate-binding protein [Myxosarcina sp. GI1]|uniref:PstS family phosphate ABC transporter substrate-binding protein n=1 Tax=Myxosarcina sp. GI1 TaxID=1541065 RepID=UPI0005647289|nr:PstS family phosphate ABC transporter substrate-binding protein [Myxosarcina sp. GI1]